MYTEKMFNLVYRHFNHPSIDKLFVVIKQADPPSIQATTYSELDKIYNTCNVCQQNLDELHWFGVFLLFSECVFNRVDSVDLM